MACLALRFSQYFPDLIKLIIIINIYRLSAGTGLAKKLLKECLEGLNFLVISEIILKMATGSFTSFGTVPKGKGQYLSGEGERRGLETREATAFGKVGRKEDYQNLHRLNPCKKPGEKSFVLRANAANNV